MELLNVINNFKINGEVEVTKRINDGLINNSFYVCTDKNRKYILQQINNFVFKNPKDIVKNIVVVTNHLKNKVDEKNLELVLTKNNDYLLELNNKIYRMYDYIDNSYTLQIKDLDNQKIFEIGKIIGKFHANLYDLDIKSVKETIKNFHNTPDRIEKLFNSYNLWTLNNDDLMIKEYIGFVKKEIDRLSIIENKIEVGSLKKHIIHNDTKLNNIMFDKKSNKAKCLIDFDTVMPGNILFDIGDALRSLGSNALEDEQKFSIIDFDDLKYYCFMIGYLSQMSDKLTEEELNLIPHSIYTITMECSIRFMTDFLDGNKYFHIDYPNHNLIRSLNQMTLAKKILTKLNSLNKNTILLYERLAKSK